MNTIENLVDAFDHYITLLHRRIPKRVKIDDPELVTAATRLSTLISEAKKEAALKADLRTIVITGFKAIDKACKSVNGKCEYCVVVDICRALNWGNEDKWYLDATLCKIEDLNTEEV